jgi:hypothetical protein
MDRFEYLLNSISVGNHTQYADNGLTIEQAHLLLIAASIRLHLKNLHPERTNIEDICYQGYKYYAYVGSFPRPHLAIDNVAGTVRLFSITTIEELEKVPVLTPPDNSNPVFSAIAAALVGVPQATATEKHNKNIYDKIVAALKK